MPLLTFTPEVQPSPGTGFRPKIKLFKAEFGDGYSQAVPVGLNHIRRELSLKWEGLTQAQAAYINDFFTDHGGYLTFLYQPVGESAPIKWTCGEWNMTAGSPWTMTAKLEESFYIGA